MLVGRHIKNDAEYLRTMNGGKDVNDRQKSYWAWGWEDKLPNDDDRRLLLDRLGPYFNGVERDIKPYPSIEEAELPECRIDIPKALQHYCSNSDYDRACHTYGKNYADIMRGFMGDFSPAPDFVAFVTSEVQISEILKWAGERKVAVIPYGGGTSVVSGTEFNGDGYKGVISLDLSKIDRVLEIDPFSLSARIQAGATGPILQDQLSQHGLTLRHYPQSFEFSTLGGWIATRAGGHFATLYTHIDDFVESIRMITPQGEFQSRRLPGSGAGPSPDRFVLGSEGTMGLISEAWVRVQKKPRFRSSASIKFKSFEQAVDVVHAISQSGLYPSNCRLLDAVEAMVHEVSNDGNHILLAGFESGDHPTQAWMERLLAIACEGGGEIANGPIYNETGTQVSQTGESGHWRDAFFEAPYLLSALISMGFVVDTFETAVTWDKFEQLHQAIQTTVADALQRECGGGIISCRFTHIYPDGPAPYYTFIAPGRWGDQLQQWQAIKKVASDTLLQHGATITHHHAVGRLHRPWYQQQAPALFEDVLRSAKDRLDPLGIMNPGVLIR